MFSTDIHVGHAADLINIHTNRKADVSHVCKHVMLNMYVANKTRPYPTFRYVCVLLTIILFFGILTIYYISVSLHLIENLC